FPRSLWFSAYIGCRSAYKSPHYDTRSRGGTKFPIPRRRWRGGVTVLASNYRESSGVFLADRRRRQMELIFAEATTGSRLSPAAEATRRMVPRLKVTCRPTSGERLRR